MKKEIRLLILLFCIVCFLAATPVLIAYSMGYRVDFETWEVRATGGIYVRSFPGADQVVFDSKIFQKPGVFSNAVFVQSLLPKNHTVMVSKSGYQDYQKTLLVQEGEVAKIENILLFKKDISFAQVAKNEFSPFLPENAREKFSIKNNNLYYSSSKENLALTPAQKSTPLVKNILAFAQSGSDLIWLSSSGNIYKAGISNLPLKADQSPALLAQEKLAIEKNGSYQMEVKGQNIFVDSNGKLMNLAGEPAKFAVFAPQANGAKISPDEKNIAYFYKGQVYISSLLNTGAEKHVLYNSQDLISNLLWINNDYLIFVAGNKIVISEIDYRGNINSFSISEAGLADGKSIALKSPRIFFDQQPKKLYILSQNNTFVSEQLIP